VARSSVALPGVSDGGAHTKFVTLGAYPTEFLTVHVRKNQIMDLEEAHWRLSGYPAYAAGLKDRGVLREGMPADIIVYDFEALEMGPPEVAHDYPANEWRRIRKAHGYRYILVNGETTFIDGECTGATPGRLLRHGFADPAPTQRLAAE
jgi:N-acyl-D-aspartate/D-glutamate deacylase